MTPGEVCNARADPGDAEVTALVYLDSIERKLLPKIAGLFSVACLLPIH
jgi:hypothetical protein